MSTNVNSNGVQQPIQINQQQITQEVQGYESYHPTIDPFRSEIMPTLHIEQYGDLFGVNKSKKQEDEQKTSLSNIDEVYPFESDDKPGLVENICNKLLSLLKIDDEEEQNPFKDIETIGDVIQSVNKPLAQKIYNGIKEPQLTMQALEEGFVSYSV